MEEKNLKKASLSGLIYRFSERIAAQLVSTVVSIVLARILMPEDYGTVALITIFITICNVLVTDGLSSSLVQKKDADDMDFSTIFWASLTLSIILYFVLFFSSPYIALYFNLPELTSIIKVLALRVPLAAVNSVQSAYVSKKLLFKKFFWATLIGTVISGVAGIVFAINGFGAWALVAQLLINPFIDTICLFVFVKWYPHMKFSYARFKELFSFGWKVLCSGLIAELYEEIRSFLIAKQYTTSDLSFYTKGKQFPEIIGNNVSATITNVMFPVFSFVQDDKERLKSMVRRSMSIACYILCPLMIGLASIARTFVLLLLTEKWIAIVPYVYVFCVLYLFKPLKNISKNSMKALKRSDLDLFVNVVEKVVGIILIFVLIDYGPIYLAYGAVVAYIIATVLNMAINSRLLAYTFKEQLKDIIPAILLSVVSCLPAFLIDQYCSFVPVIEIIAQIGVSVAIYILLSIVFKFEQLYYICNTMKSVIRKK